MLVTDIVNIFAVENKIYSLTPLVLLLLFSTSTMLKELKKTNFIQDMKQYWTIECLVKLPRTNMIKPGQVHSLTQVRLC